MHRNTWRSKVRLGKRKHGYPPALGASQYVFLLGYIYQAFIFHNDHVEFRQQPKEEQNSTREYTVNSISYKLAYKEVNKRVFNNPILYHLCLVNCSLARYCKA